MDSTSNFRPKFTLVSGIPKAGKTLFIRKLGAILQKRVGMKCAALPKESFSSGCVWEFDEIIPKAIEFSDQGIQHLFLESRSLVDPLIIAETILFKDEGDTSDLAEIFSYDGCITVVNAKTFYENLACTKQVQEVFPEDLGDQRMVVQVMLEQIEYASVVYLANSSDMPPQEKQAIVSAINCLNPKAAVVDSFEVPQAFFGLEQNHDDCVANRKWLLDKTPCPEKAEESKLFSFVFREKKPFHSERLHAFLNTHLTMMPDQESSSDEVVDEIVTHKQKLAEKAQALEDAKAASEKYQQGDFKGVIRSRGTVWLASNAKFFALWAQVLANVDVSSEGPWLSNTDDEAVERLPMAEDLGDRTQNLIFSGMVGEMNEDKLRAGLEKCLVTEEELATMKVNNMELEDGNAFAMN